MPKTPINERKMLIVPVRGPGYTPRFRRFDWNIVETDLGTMVESSAGSGFNGMDRVQNLDMTDALFNSVEIIDEGDFSRRFEHGGPVVLTDFNA